MTRLMELSKNQRYSILRIIKVTISGGFRGGSGGLLEPPSGTKLFQFHGEIYEKLGKM